MSGKDQKRRIRVHDGRLTYMLHTVSYLALNIHYTVCTSTTDTEKFSACLIKLKHDENLHKVLLNYYKFFQEAYSGIEN